MDVVSYNTTNPGKVSSKVLQQVANRQALVFGKVMKICLNEPACKCLFMWDDADYNSRKPAVKYSWLQPSEDGVSAPVYWYPTLNPNNYSPKPGWYAMRDTLSNFTGVYRVASLWQPASSGYLARFGSSSMPSNQVGLLTLNTQSSSWTSMKWRFERVDIDIYRIACTWGYVTGYLTRLGVQDPNSLEYYPGSDVYVQDLHTDWFSQQWILYNVYDNQYSITSRWGSDGTLTRLGVQGQSGVWQPTNKVILLANSNYTSQTWALERV